MNFFKSAVDVTPKVPALVMCNPKFPHNAAAAIRTCSCYGIEQVWITGERLARKVFESKRIPREERMKGYKDVSLILDERPFNHLPEGVIPVAVELVKGAENLLQFEHPENAVYVFGPEDGSIPRTIQRLCHRRVFIPTKHCLNLTMAMGTLFYDRLYKQYLNGQVDSLPIAQCLDEQRGWPSDDPVFQVTS